jgi:hypothetical protein
MTKSELTIGLSAIIGILLKALMIPGSDLILTLSFTAFAVYYYFLGFSSIHGIPIRKVFKKDSYKGISAMAIIGSIVLGWSLSTIALGVLFRLLFLPGGNPQLTTGIAALLLLFVVVIIKYIMKRKEYLKRAVVRILIGVSVGAVLLITPNNTLVDVLFFLNSEYAEVYKEHLDNPDNEELRKKVKDMKYSD